MADESRYEFAKRFASELIECIEVMEIENAKDSMDLLGSLATRAGGVNHDRVMRERSLDSLDLGVDTLIYQQLTKQSKSNEYMREIGENAGQWMSYYGITTKFDIEVSTLHMDNFESLAPNLAFKLDRESDNEKQSREFLEKLKVASDRGDKSSVIREHMKGMFDNKECKDEVGKATSASSKPRLSERMRSFR
ncbi:hypothetical protein VCHA53O466_50426 [Vibrio chagasii]|nr:hypothetical protein VCHA53O466_50426 [Vibrio chagasii]